MKVYQIIHEQDVVSGAINSLSNAIQSVVGSQSTSAPAQSNGQQPTSGSANEAINAAVQQLYPRIDRAIQQGDRSTLTRTLSRSAQYVIRQLPNPDALDAHLIDRLEDAVYRQVIARMARSFNRYDAAASRDIDKWVRIARSDPRMFIDIVIDPSRMSEYGL